MNPLHSIPSLRFSINTIRKSRSLVRLLALLAFVSIAAIALGATSSSATVFGPMFTRAASIFGAKVSAPETKAASVSPALQSEESSEPLSPSSAMATERRGHTATRLSNGSVLIAGGENSNGVLNQTEIYDATTDTFSAVSNMNDARTDHTATLLSDGRVLIAGGRNSAGALTTTEIFDPAVGTFSSGPNMSVARAGHSATLFSDGRILFAGGDAGGSAEILDAALSESTAVGSLGTARSMHSAALLQDGHVLIVGGRDVSGIELSSGEIFDTTGGSFSNVDSSLKVSRVHALLRVLFDGKVQIIGGNTDGSMEVYDPQIQGFGAYAHVLPEGDTCAGLPGQVKASQTRAALFHNGQTDQDLDRSSHSITELAAQAIVVGGVNSAGNVLSSTPLFSSSAAEISTDKLDYAPGETAHIIGHGFQAGETVRLKIHEDPHTPQERGLDVVADGEGSFVGDYLVQTYDLSMKFLVGARGLTSGLTAQTTFTDATGTRIRAVTMSPSSGACGSTITVSATLESTPGPFPPIPGKTVNFTLGSSTGSGVTNASGVATASMVVPAGATTLVASFAGDGTFNAVTTSIPFTVTGSCSIATTTSINAPTITYNANGSVVVTVSSSSGTPTGNVSLSVDAGSAVSKALTSGSATFTSLDIAALASPNAGDHSLSANYAAQGSFAASSETGNLHVDKAASTTTVNCPPNVTYTGSALEPCTATATGAGGLSVSVTVVYGNNTNAGTATADATYGGDTNHNGSTATQVTFTIDKASSSTTINCPPNVTYTGSALEPCTATATGAGGLSVSVTVVYGNNTNAGTATANATYGGDANHNGSSATQVTFTIDKASSSTTINCPTNVTYTGSALEPCTATATGAGGLSVSVTVVYGNNTNAGTATANATYGGDANHNGSSATQVTFTIDKASSSTTINCPPNVTYTGSALEPCTATATGAGGLSVSVTVVYGNNTNAGTATADATYGGDANHNGSTATQVTFTIDKASSSTTINCPPNVTYTGSALEPCTATATGAGGLSVSVTVVYGNNTNAGTATADATYGGDTNHNGSSATQVTFTIDKASSSTTINCPTNVTYTGSALEPCTATATGAGGLSVSVTVVYGNNTNAGTATADATYAGDANHNGSTATQVSFTIDKAASSTTINCPPNVTYTGSALEPCTATATGAGGLSVSVTVVYGNNTNAGTATADATYGGDANHNGSVATQVSFTIDKAASTTTITCGAGPFTYDGTPQTPCSATATGAGGLNVSVTVVYGNNTNAGTATADATYGGDANHNGSSATQVTFVINKRTLTASIIGNPTKVYDGNTDAALTTANFSLGNLVGVQSFTVTKATGTYNSKDVATANTVSTTLTVADFTSVGGTNANNYNLPTSASGAGHITAKALTIKADDKTMPFGGPVPAYTVTYTTLVSGDTPSSLGGTLAFTVKDMPAMATSIAVNGSTPSGTYAIIPSGLTSTNYTITFSNGVLTINSWWTITGFYQPVDMNIGSMFVLNTIKGGSTVPLKFNIYAGTPGPLTERKSISDVMFGSVQVAEYTCSSTPGYESPMDVPNTGSTSLRYDTTGAQFIQNWQTPKPPNKCYQVRMTALDGSHIDAYFKTK